MSRPIIAVCCAASLGASTAAAQSISLGHVSGGARRCRRKLCVKSSTSSAKSGPPERGDRPSQAFHKTYLHRR